MGPLTRVNRGSLCDSEVSYLQRAAFASFVFPTALFYFVLWKKRVINE